MTDYRKELAKMYACNKLNSDEFSIAVKLSDKRNTLTDARAKRYYTRELNRILKGEKVNFEHLKHYI